MLSQQTTAQTHNIKVIIDRISICNTDKNPEHVKATAGLLLSDLYTKQIPGMKITSNARYEVSAAIPVPFMQTGAGNTHTIYFEVGPKQHGWPSYRLDFNPSKLTAAGLDDLMVLLDSTTDATPFEFFCVGRITRVDAAIDIPGFTLNELLVLTQRKQKHGVYSDRYGNPETTYFGTPRSARLVAYSKPTLAGASVRLEWRGKPKCPGHEIAALKNPFKKIELIRASVLDDLSLGIPGQPIADSIRVRGIKRSLQVFPPQTRKLIITALYAAKSLLPNADQIWAGWPQALIAVGLGEELGALPSGLLIAAQ